MTPYFIIYFIFTILALSENYRLNIIVDNKNLIRFLGIGIILLFMGLKYHVGGDWGSYTNYFNDSLSLKINIKNISNDYGFYLMNFAIAYFGLDFYFLNLISALIFLFGIHSISKQYVNYWLFIIILMPYYIFIVGMGYTRQSVSIGFFLVALSYLFKKQNIKSIIYYYLLISMALLFHKSVAIFYILPLFIIRITFIKTIPIILLTFLISIFSLYFLFNSNIIIKLTYFFENSYSSFGGYLRTYILAFLAFFYLVIIDKLDLNIERKKISKIISFYILFLSIFILFSPSTVVIDRLLLYFHFLYAAIILILYEYSKNIYTKNILIYGSIFIGNFFLFTWFNFADNAFSWVPYSIYKL